MGVLQQLKKLKQKASEGSKTAKVKYKAAVDKFEKVQQQQQQKSQDRLISKVKKAEANAKRVNKNRALEKRLAKAHNTISGTRSSPGNKKSSSKKKKKEVDFFARSF